MGITSVWESLARALSPVEERPRVAPNLEAAAYTTRAGAGYVVVHRPDAHAYARLDPREYELLELMDGTRSVKELVIAYYQRHSALALPRIAGLIHLLRTQGFLRGAAGVNAYAAIREKLRPTRAERELTTDRLDAVLAAWYAAWGHVFFRRVWLIVGVVMAIVGPLAFVIELGHGTYPLFGQDGSPLLTVVLLVAIALAALGVHELGHGLAVKHAGRKVARSGVRLYYALPAAYVDTTDVWMAPPRQRLLTAFAGPWTGLVLGGLAALAALLLPISGLGALLFTAGFVFLVDNLFNFNPLLELDGYYMLVDLLDRPLLRPRALAFVRGPLWRKLAQRQSLSGDERLFAVFGLGAMVYSVLAILLAARSWQGLLLPLALEGWSSGGPLARVGVALVAIVVAAAVLLWVWALARRLLIPTSQWLTWLSRTAAAHRHREALGALRAVPMWATLPQERLLEVARAMRAEAVAPGTEVVRQGEPGACFYLVGQGAFEVLVDDLPQVRLGRGDYFGERALLNRAARAATVVAVEPSRVFSLQQADFDALLLAHDLATRERLTQAVAYREQVAEMPLFRDLAPAELDLLLVRLQSQSAQPGEVIIRQGDVGQRFYIVRSGHVEVVRDGSVLALLGPGEAFGEIALLLDVPRTATVAAQEATELLSLDAEAFRDLLASYLGRGEELSRLSHLRLSTHHLGVGQ